MSSIPENIHLSNFHDKVKQTPGLNGFVCGLKYVFSNYAGLTPKFTYQDSDLDRRICRYRNNLYRSAHYRSEIGLYTHTAVLSLLDYEKISPSSAAREVVGEAWRPYSLVNTLLSRLDDWLLLAYAYDDLLDNSPLRGSSVAWHLVTSPAEVHDMYWHSRAKLVEASQNISGQAASEVSGLVDQYDGAAEDEGDKHYYRFEGKDDPERAFTNLKRKGKFFSGIVFKPLHLAAGILIPDLWRYAIQSGYEAAWLVNDFFKNATEFGLGRWLELKQGRLPLPIIVAMHSVDANSREQLTTVIGTIWKMYKPFFEERLDLDSLRELKSVDRSGVAKFSLKKFDQILKSTKVREKIEAEVESRRNAMRKVSKDDGGLDHLDVFDFALTYYLVSKKLRIGLFG